MEEPTVDHEFFERIRREHEELRQLLGRVHGMLAKRLETVTRVSEMLGALGEHVDAHFQEEEIAGFFDEVVDRAPRLSERIDALREQHQQLLETVRGLNRVASEGDGSDDWWQRLEAAFHNFSTELMHHESSETDILQQAYGEDIGAAD